MSRLFKDDEFVRDLRNKDFVIIKSFCVSERSSLPDYYEVKSLISNGTRIRTERELKKMIVKPNYL